MVRRLALVLALMLAAPAAAGAAEVRVERGVLEYTGAPGRVSNITLRSNGGGSVTVTRFPDSLDDDPITGCGAVAANSATCAGVTTRVDVDLGDRGDRVDASELGSIPAMLTGGDGNDFMRGTPVNDVLRGGDGNDDLQPDNGTDALAGGDGIDTALYGFRDSPSYTLDGLANDGEAGENDLIGTDIENIDASSDEAGATAASIVGDGRANRLTVTGGRGVVTGGEGPDILEGGPFGDVLRSRDGSPDTVICNGGADTVEADTLDTVSPTCENVSVQASPGGPFDDRPPLIAWSTPGAGVSLTANGATTLSVNATDDRGIARVQFFDDDRLLCEVAAPPFACAYQPRGGDVGRNTLIAIAVDTANQTTSVVRAVTVRRFTPPALSLSLRPSRDRRPPYSFRATGRLERPRTVAPSQGCSGTVTITAKAGRKVVTRHRTALSRTCEFSTIVRFRGRRKPGRLRLSARFGGNDVLVERSSRSRTVRLG